MTATWNFCSIGVTLCNKSYCSQVVKGTELTLSTHQGCSMQCYLFNFKLLDYFWQNTEQGRIYFYIITTCTRYWPSHTEFNT